MPRRGDENSAWSRREQGELLDRLGTIPGIEKTTAQTLLVELGTDMTRFPSAVHAASWAVLFPALRRARASGFRQDARRRPLSAPGLSAERLGGGADQGLLFGGRYSTAQRRGPKKAAVAVAHRLLQIVYDIIQSGEVDRERGGNFFDNRSPVKTANRLAKRPERTGFVVTLVPRRLPGLGERSLFQPTFVAADMAGRTMRFYAQVT